MKKLVEQKLVEQIKQALNALSYADIGERVGRREKHAALFPEHTPNAVAPNPAHGMTRQWIALGVGDSLPAHVMAYVIGACRRMQANLLLISRDALQVRALLNEYLPDLQGITCQTEALSSSASASVVAALNLHSGLLFAVSSAEHDPLRPLLRPRRGPRSPVPIVLVTPKPAVARTPGRLKAVRT